MPGEGQFVSPVQVEVTSDIGADVAADGTGIPGADLRGMATLVFDDTGAGTLYVPRCNANGQIEVEVVAMPPMPPPTPGLTILSVTVPVGIGATVPIPAPPASTYAVNCQNVSVGVPGATLAVREVGGAAGAGMFLPLYGIFTFDKAVNLMEVQDVGGVGGTLIVTYEAL